MDWSIEKVNQNGKICTFIFWIFLLAKQLCDSYRRYNEVDWSLLFLWTIYKWHQGIFCGQFSISFRSSLRLFSQIKRLTPLPRKYFFWALINFNIIWLATLLEGAGLAFDILKVFKISKINYGCFKALKLVKKVLNGPSNQSRCCYHFFYFGDIKKIFYWIFRWC